MWSGRGKEEENLLEGRAGERTCVWCWWVEWRVDVWAVVRVSE